MKREDIEKAAVDSCVIENSIFNPELTPYYEQGFADGAEWRINSVWHDASEKPKEKEHIVVVSESGNFISWFATNDIMEVFKKHSVKMWVYSKDILPTKEGEQ